jgi:hypothetical protein
MNTTHFCKKCQNIKEITEFNKHCSSKTGFRDICKICQKQYRQVYYNKNKTKELAKNGFYRKNNVEKMKTIYKNYSLKNPDKIKAKSKAYYEANRNILIKKSVTNHKKRKKEDLQFRIACNLRTRLNNAINRNKPGSAIKDLGCTLDFFKKYIETKFEKNMSWNNYGKFGWHIDHIKPLSSFNLTDREEIIKACHYTNLQPLWMVDNLKKSNKIN